MYCLLQLLVLVSGTQSLVCITVGRHFLTVNSCMARYFTVFCYCKAAVWSGGIMVKVLDLWLKRSQVQISAVPLSLTAHTHTHLMALCPGLLRWAGTRKVKPIWILLKQETVSGSGISWAICKPACCSRQITTPAPHHSVFLQARCPSCYPTNSVKALKANR